MPQACTQRPVRIDDTKDADNEDNTAARPAAPRKPAVIDKDLRQHKAAIAEDAPGYVNGTVSIKSSEFVAFLQANEKNSGWVNIDLLVGKSGMPYAALNIYEVERPASLGGAIHEKEINPDEIPF